MMKISFIIVAFNAAGSLNALLDKAKPSVVASFNAPHDAQRLALKSAYEYWLKANGQLQSMGIYPLPLSIIRNF